MPATNLKNLTSDAGKNVFGFKANSRSLRPIHFTHPLFSHCLGYNHVYDADLLDFWDKPSKQAAEDLDDSYTELFEGQGMISNERIDLVRQYMRLVLDNDDVLYNSTVHNAPTCTSDWLVTKVIDAVSVGRFLYELICRADSTLQRKIVNQLQDHHDGISLLFRPLINVGATKNKDVTVSRWDGPKMGDASAFGTESVASNLVAGFDRLNTHIRSPRRIAGSYPHDLERIIKFSSFAFYLYLINRNTEVRSDTGHEYRLPMLIDYTNSEGSINDASIQNANIAHSEVENATRYGVRSSLESIGWKSLDNAEVEERFVAQDLIGLNRSDDDKIKAEYTTLRSMYEVEPNPDTFDKLVNVMSDAIHDSTFNTYPPRNTAQTFGWRIGLLKPRGNRANQRWFQPDPELLECIVLSLIEPGSKNRITLPKFCERLRDQYGIIVGGNREDRAHLNDWSITVGTSPDNNNPLRQNYEAFQNMLADLGYATKYADGVTLVEVNSHEY
jgi:hypothetical protein